MEEYAEQTRTAGFWRTSPVVFPSSIDYMATHFKEYDPRRTHRYLETRFKVYVPSLVHVAPAFSGRSIEVLGQVSNFISSAHRSRQAMPSGSCNSAPYRSKAGWCTAD